MRFVVAASVVLCSGVGCTEGRRPSFPPPPPCGVVREQALQPPAPPGCFSWNLDEAAGGPLLCRPGVEDDCRDVSCVTDPIEVPVAVSTTLAFGILDECATGLGIQLSSVLLLGEDPVLGADPAFTLLEPHPTSIVDEGFIFLSVTPTEVGRVETTLSVDTDARNVPFSQRRNRNAASLHIVVDAVAQ